MEYTLEDVLEYWQSIKPAQKTRKRKFIDPRNYIIALLYYKFNVKETELDTLIGIERSTVNHAKRHPYHLIKAAEAAFMRNTEEVRKMFPYNFPSSDQSHLVTKKIMRRYSYTIHFDRNTYLKIKKYSKLKEIDPRRAIRNLIQKSLGLWEE